MKKVWNVVSTILVVLVVLLAVLLAGARLAGFHLYSVLSGSMEPTYHVGAVIYVKDVDPFAVQPGQVITFMMDEETVVTHRVVEVVPDPEDSSVVWFVTKGDANEINDFAPVHYKNVIGTPVFTIPYLGYFSDYIQHPPGMYFAIAAAVLMVLLAFLPDLFAEDDGKKKKAKKGEEKAPASPDSPEETNEATGKEPVTAEEPVSAPAGEKEEGV